MKSTIVWWSFFTFVLFFALVHLGFLYDVTNALSISPPSEEIFSNQLCPDPTTRVSSQTSESSSWSSWWSSTKISTRPIKSLIPEKVLVVNLDKPKESTHFYESCSFKEQWEPGSGNQRVRHSVRVRSINLNVNPWNFTNSQKCNTFIKFNNWDVHDSGLVVGGRYPVLCGRENFDQYLGPYGHPMVLYYQWKKGGLSFPLFHSSYGEQHKDRKEPMELQYMQIYFVVSGSKGIPKTCRVQQYRLDWLRIGCSSSMLLDDYEEEEVCGEYSCLDLEALYQSKMTIFKDGESDNDTMLVWKTKADKYKMRSFLRQKFVPIVFLIVCACAYRSYMKAGLRYQNSIQDDLSEFRVRSVRSTSRAPQSTRAPGTSRGYSTSAPRRDVAYWGDFTQEEEDDDPPPQYVANNNNNNTAPPRLNDAVVTDRPQNESSSSSSNNAATTITSTTSVSVGVQAQPQKQQQSDEADIEPPPPYHSVFPPTYGEALISTTK